MIQIQKALYIVDMENPDVRKHIQQILKSDFFSETSVTFLTVVPAGRNWGTFARRGVRIDEVESIVVENARIQLEELIESVEYRRDDFKIRVLAGRPTEVLPAFMQLEPHDLIIKTPSADYSTLDKIFGRQDLRLIRSSTTPILIRRPWDEYTKVMVAVDLNAGDGFVDALNRSILKCAASVALSKGCELHIVHCWRLYGETLLASSKSKVSNTEFIELLKAEEESRRRLLDELCKDFIQFVKKETGKEIKPVTHLVKGNAVDTVPIMVKETGAELLVLGTVCRQGMKAVVIGNTAESIIHNTDASILTVAP